MLEYRPKGVLLGAGPDRRLVLPEGRPLSYLRVRDADGRTLTLARALLEHQATEFRRRVPLIRPRDRSLEEIGAAFERLGVSQTIPVLHGRRNDAEVDLLWLDRVQMQAIGSETAGFALSTRAVVVGGLRISPAIGAATGPNGGDRGVPEAWKYWNSSWTFVDPPPEEDSWWRVRPNIARERPQRLPFVPRADARGTFVACLHPEMRELLGKPRYIIVEHPHRTACLPVLALEDDRLRQQPTAVWDQTIFLDRTARDALGIADGEFCRVSPWLRPRRAVWARSVRDRYVGSRMIAAQVRTSARADLEKPVCRMEEEALAAIGGRASEFVRIEHVVRHPKSAPGSADRWQRVRKSQRVLPIDPGERAKRAQWEAPQLWDESSVGGDSDSPDRSNLKLEGYVDCAESLGVQPPYPTIYLNYYTRQHDLKGVGLCQPVQVQVSVASRVMAEASDFAWLVFIGLLAAAMALLDLAIGVAVALLAAVTVLLVIFRALRAIR